MSPTDDPPPTGHQAMPDEPIAVVDLIAAPPPPPGGNWVRRFIVDYNPFFLLSALCMLGGSLALTNSLSWSPVRLERILVLVATINVYELLLVALGLFLIVRRNARRDGAILLIVEACFLVDVAFLNAELFAIDRWIGLWANFVLLAVAVAKLVVIFRVLRVDLNNPVVTFVMAELVALYALPGALKFYAAHLDGRLPQAAMFTTWWMLCGLGVVGFVVARNARHLGRAAWFVPTLAILCGVSLLAHAGTCQWVYDLRYWGAHLSPMLVLATFVLCHYAALRPAGVLSAMAAVLASLSHNNTLRFGVPGGGTLTPIHVALAAVYVVVAWTMIRQAFALLMGAGALAGVIALFGPSVMTMRGWAHTVLATIVAWIDAIRPRTQTHWGILSIVMSFVFLAVGAVVSLRRAEADQPAEGSAA